MIFSIKSVQYEAISCRNFWVMEKGKKHNSSSSKASLLFPVFASMCCERGTEVSEGEQAHREMDGWIRYKCIKSKINETKY